MKFTAWSLLKYRSKLNAFQNPLQNLEEILKISLLTESQRTHAAIQRKGWLQHKREKGKIHDSYEDSALTSKQISSREYFISKVVRFPFLFTHGWSEGWTTAQVTTCWTIKSVDAWKLFALFARDIFILIHSLLTKREVFFVCKQLVQKLEVVWIFMDFFQNSDEVEIFRLFVRNRWNWKSEWFNASFSRLSSQSQWREQSKMPANLEQSCTPYEVYLYRGEGSAYARWIESFQFSPMKRVLILTRRNVCMIEILVFHCMIEFDTCSSFVFHMHWSLCE